MNYRDATAYLAKLGVPDIYRHQCLRHLPGPRWNADDLEAMADWCLESIREEKEEVYHNHV